MSSLKSTTKIVYFIEFNLRTVRTYINNFQKMKRRHDKNIPACNLTAHNVKYKDRICYTKHHSITSILLESEVLNSALTKMISKAISK